MAGKKIKRVAFAGGGSGGHLYPQVAVAGEIKNFDPSVEIYFVSAKGSIEEKLVPMAGYELVLIPSGKLKGQGLLSTIKTLLSLFLSIFVCAGILIRRRPDLIFSAGGYAGAPFLVLGSLFGIHCEILEQNRMPGMANRWMAKFCKRVYVNFAASAEKFPGKDTRAVGHPCRPEIEAARWSPGEEERLFAANPFRIFVFGGSQGAMGINRLMAQAAPHWKDLDIEILHQTGEADFERTKREYQEAGFSRVRVEKFIFEMAESFKSSHLVICRAGAGSLAELAAAGKAAFLIPLVSKDRHQEFNANEIAHLGAALTELQGKLTGSSLADAVKGLYSDRAKLKSLSHRMAELHKPDAAIQIARGILEG